MSSGSSQETQPTLVSRWTNGLAQHEATSCEEQPDCKVMGCPGQGVLEQKVNAMSSKRYISKEGRESNSTGRTHDWTLSRDWENL